MLPPDGPLGRLIDVGETLDLRRTPEGDGTIAFVAFYRVEYPGAVRLAHALAGSAEVAEDIAQDAFGRILGRIEGLENPRGICTPPWSTCAVTERGAGVANGGR